MLQWDPAVGCVRWTISKHRQPSAFCPHSLDAPQRASAKLEVTKWIDLGGTTGNGARTGNTVAFAAKPPAVFSLFACTPMQDQRVTDHGAADAEMVYQGLIDLCY